ncbi:MAG: IPT/TIG domain-containing protein [Bryobacteraceae bacterium]
MTRFLRVVAVLMSAVAIPASAQVWDFTGNNLLNGAYVFREAIYIANSSGSITRAIVDYGTITFNGRGGYTLSANEIDSSSGSTTYSQNGTYSISASGYGFMTHPYGTNLGSLHGTVSANGVFVGSATEAGINDIMIAVPASSATNASFSGNYTMDYFNISTSGQTAGLQVGSYGSIAQLSPNGSGNTFNVPVKTYLGTANSQPVNQTENGVSYSFTSGIGTLRFPTSTTTNLAIQGNKIMYISPDGNLIFGGSATGFDFFVGVKRGNAPRLDGLYYSAGINDIPGSLDTFYGAFTAGGTVLLEHQRYLSTASGRPLNYTGVSVLPNSAVTDYVDTLSAVDYTVSQDAGIRIGVGQTPYLGLRIAVRGPKFTAPSSAPYVDPTGVINAASFAPFTTGLAPGELISIYGANLAGSTTVTKGGVTFPTTLANVRVLMNNRPAAIYFVSPGQIAAIVPYGTTEGVVQVQVERDGVLSNTVTLFRYLTSPGIFSQSQSGEGVGAVLHSDFRLITEASPARPGEVVQVFLTGIGSVFPAIPDGAPGGGTASTLNQTSPGTVSAYVDNLPADVSYAGLAPLLSGLYQVNLKVPDDASTGNVALDIATADSYTTQVALPVGPAVAAAAVSRKAEEKPFVRRR